MKTDNSQEHSSKSECFLKKVFEPFKVIMDCKTEFFLWALFTLLAGQLGIITNLIIRVFSGKYNFEQSLYLDSTAGNFYIFAIAIVASMLGNVFTTFLKKSEVSFRHIRIIVCSLLVVFLGLIALIYSSVQLGMPDVKLNKDINYVPDLWQSVTYALSILISVYCFCIIKLNLEKFSILSSPEDYSNQETKEVDELTKNALQIKRDGDLTV